MIEEEHRAFWIDFWKSWANWQGQLEAGRATLLLILEDRFGSPLPDDVGREIASARFPKELQEWTLAATKARDLNQWRVGLRLPTV